MSQIAVYFALILGGLLLVPLAERIRQPAPVLATVYGLLLALPGFFPRLHVAPDALLPLLLPPLLYAAARRSSWRQFAANLRPILLLAVGLVFVTAAAVAVVAASVHPLLPLGTAVVMGAVVSPPDAAAVTTIAHRLGLPRRLVTILEGEGLFNDVVALTLYQVAVAGVVAGSVTAFGAIGSFVYSCAAAIVIGLLVGYLASLALDRFDDARLTTGLSLLAPYLAYIPADEIRASGVLAVLTTAFMVRSRATDPDDIEGRLIRGSFWDVTELMVTTVTFGIVGFELIDVVQSVENAPVLVWKAILIALVVIGVRIGWMFLALSLTRLRGLWRGPQVNWRVAAVVAWSGMRGVVTIVTALAIPQATDAGKPFPGRDQILLIAMVVVVSTLLLQGMTLPSLIKLIGVQADARREDAYRKSVLALAHDAASRRLDELVLDGEVPNRMAERLKEWFAAVTDEGEPVDADEDARRTERREIRRKLRYCESELLSAARSALVDTRMSGGHDPAVIDDVLQTLDLRSVGGAK